MSQELFSVGEQGSKMFFCAVGVLEYYHLNDERNGIEAYAGQRFCEVVIWAKWEHKGRLSSVTPCEFVALDASVCRKIISRRPHLLGAFRDYAKRYKQLMLEKGH